MKSLIKLRYAGLLLGLLMLPGPASGHGLRYQVGREEVVVIKVTYANKNPFSHQHYEIFRPNETAPCLTGRTDADGRIRFVPDSSGTWQIKTFSEDGHGLSIPLATEGREVFLPPAKPPSGRYTGLLLGLVIILGFFNLYSLFLRRKKQAAPA